MVAGLIIVPVVSLFTPMTDKKIVDFAFSGYEETVVVPVRESLGDQK